MDAIDDKHISWLAAHYRARAESAEPTIARILLEIADDLHEEARRSSERSRAAGG